MIDCLHHIKSILLLLAFVLPAEKSFAQAIIANGPFWYDTDGNVIEAHGAGFLQIGDTFYWFGSDKTANSNVFTAINCYASTDLVNWEFRNAVVTNATHPHIGDYLGSRVIERPKVIFNESTGKYVMWAHWDWKNYGEAEAVVFQCDQVDGDYEMISHFRPFDNMARDCGLYKVQDGTAYFFAAANNNADMILYRLTDDYLDVEEEVATLWPGSHRESPVIFQDETSFYFISSGTTGWEPNQGKIGTASSIEGPWSWLKSFGDNTTFDSQPTYVIPVMGSEDTTYIYCGDRWKDPQLKDSKYIWLPIVESPYGKQIKYLGRWTIDVEKGTWTEIKYSILPQDKWKLISVDSEDTFGHIGQNAIDGNPNTFWHTEWEDNKPPHPHEIAIDLESYSEIYGLKYLPRQDGNSNGTISDYQFYVSNDSLNWGEPIKSGTFQGGSTEKFILFGDTIRCRYIRLLSLSALNDSPFASIAELNMLGEYESPSRIIDINQKVGEFRLYPNPCVGTNIYIQNSTQIETPLGVVIYDLKGKSVFSAMLSVGQDEIKLDKKLIPGVYVIEIRSKQNKILLRKQLVAS